MNPLRDRAAATDVQRKSTSSEVDSQQSSLTEMERLKDVIAEKLLERFGPCGFRNILRMPFPHYPSDQASVDSSIR